MNDFINFSKNRKIYNKKIESRVAIFIFLYYEDTVEDFFSVIRRIPSEVDIYILTSNKHIVSLAKKTFGNRITYLNTINRGRDISALLVVASKYINNYDFFCFVHDKSEKEEEQKDYAKRWKHLFLESMLASESYIYQVIDFLRLKDSIGIMIPPAPIGDYSSVWYTGGWGNNYDNTVALAKRIGLNVDISIDDEFFSFGTMFWARTRAMKKLFNYDWRYEDFPDEPLPDDGEISHAVERILPYVVRDSGFEVVNCSSSEYVNEYLMQVLKDYRTAAKILNKEYGICNQRSVNMFYERRKKLERFVHDKKKLYIYGAGRVGKACKQYLEKNGLHVDGFLVSQANGLEFVEGIPVLCINEIMNRSDTAIFVAARTDNKKQMIDFLREKHFDCYMEYV